MRRKAGAKGNPRKELSRFKQCVRRVTMDNLREEHSGLFQASRGPASRIACYAMDNKQLCIRALSDISNDIRGQLAKAVLRQIGHGKPKDTDDDIKGELRVKKRPSGKRAT